MRNFIFCLAFFLLYFNQSFYAQTPIRIKASTTRHGPENGSLILIGGGLITPEIWGKFTELAGGAEKANVVVITAASGDSAAYNTKAVDLVKRETGIKNVTLLHTSNLAEANSEKFVAPLKKSTGVFFVGGRQWRIADSYLNTLTHQEFFDLLNRGGVIAGTSAGATVQGSFLWRGDTSGPQILVGDHTQGLAFLKNSVIDQHFLQRNRQFDLVPFIKAAPQILGIALDESTAIVVQKDTLEVLGKSYIAIYDYNTINGNGAKHVKNNTEDFTAADGPFFFLHAGQRYDMGSRKVLKPQPKQ